MDRQQVTSFLAALTDEEFDEIADEARGIDRKARSAERAGDWQQSMALKAQRLHKLMRGGN